MKKAVLLALLFVLSGVPFVFSDVSIDLKPDPLYDQLWAFETYLLNISEPTVNLSTMDLTGLDLTGNLVYNVSIQWRGVGQYHHGDGVTGYSYDLSKAYFQNIEDMGLGWTSFNLTLNRDTYRLGMKPYEEVQVIFRVDVFLEVVEYGAELAGPLVESNSRTLILVDEDKVDYLEDKFKEFSEDVGLVVSTPSLSDFNRSRYSTKVDEMNHSLSIGNYVDALDQWEKWDNKGRVRMFEAFSSKVSDQSELLLSLQEIEGEFERLQKEYDFLEDKYVAVFKESRQNLAELEVTEQGLTTAITGVFLSAIVFFFLGRRSSNGVAA